MIDRFGHAPDNEGLVRDLVLDHQWFGPIHVKSPFSGSVQRFRRAKQRHTGLVPAEVIR
jgi:hypothetical protein